MEPSEERMDALDQFQFDEAMNFSAMEVDAGQQRLSSENAT